MRCQNILEAVGRTPLIRLNRLTRGMAPEIYVKCDYLNPGGSVKDRVAIRMVQDAEQRGLLKPGGTIIEGTSGNTGMGLALVAAVKGYKVIFTMTDKQSREKINLLKALGAEVIVCPTAVRPDDPRSYYSVAKKLAREIPNSYYPNQYDNPMNPLAHYETTGPEIWEDTEGKITHFVAGMGTGGSISGIAKFLKEKNEKVKVIGVDPIGSLYYEFFTQGKIGTSHTYKVEGIGEDIFPSTMDFRLIDQVVQVTDKECFLWARKLARMEGIFAGGSTGGAVSVALAIARTCGEKDVIVLFIPDTGMRYLSKVYNDEWMRENQYLEAEFRLSAGEIIAMKDRVQDLLFVRPHETLTHALTVMQKKDISQIPVFEESQPVGSLYEEQLMDLALQGKDLSKLVVREVMGKPLPIVAKSASIEEVTSLITSQNPAIFVNLGGGRFDIITKYDLVRSIARITEGGASGR